MGFTNFNDLISQVIEASNGGNRNIKSITPDGKVEFFDDAVGAVQGATGGTTASPTPTTPPLQQQEQGGIFSDPGLAKILGDLGQALSQPGSGAFNVGAVASNMAESRIFNQLLNDLIGRGTNQNPNNPAVNLSNLSAAGLSPELQMSALRSASDLEAQEFDNLLNLAQAQNIQDIRRKRPTLKQQTDEQIRAGLALQRPQTFRMTLNVDSSGNPTQGKDKHAWLINAQTGDRIAYLGPDDRVTGGGGSSVADERLWYSMADRQAKAEVVRQGWGELVNNPDGSKTFKFIDPEKGQKAYVDEMNRAIDVLVREGKVRDGFRDLIPQAPEPQTIPQAVEDQAKDSGFLQGIKDFFSFGDDTDDNQEFKDIPVLELNDRAGFDALENGTVFMSGEIVYEKVSTDEVKVLRDLNAETTESN